MKISVWTEAALRLLFPENCLLCQVELNLESRTLCPICRCLLDGTRINHEDTPPVTAISGIRRQWAFYTYESPARELLQDFKFNQKTWILDTFEAAFENFIQKNQDPIDRIVPIPIHRSKLLTREFNPPLMIAQLLSRKTGFKVLEALGKPYPTPAQSSLSRYERKINLRGAFKLRKGSKVRGRSILLVDDILTTGATAEEAANVLKKAGARKVYLFTLARTGPESFQNQKNRAEVFS